MSNGQLILVEEIDIDVETAHLDAPHHASDQLVEWTESLDARPEVAGGQQQVQTLLVLGLLLLVVSNVSLASRTAGHTDTATVTY